MGQEGHECKIFTPLNVQLVEVEEAGPSGHNMKCLEMFLCPLPSDVACCFFRNDAINSAGPELGHIANACN